MSATALDVALRWRERRAEVRELLKLLGSGLDVLEERDRKVSRG
jgi:hypothetical protein